MHHATERRQPLSEDAGPCATSIVGIAEIAERLGTTEKVVATWQARGWPAGRPRKAEPPKCEAIISGRFSVYRWAEVERWARESGRIKCRNPGERSMKWTTRETGASMKR